MKIFVVDDEKDMQLSLSNGSEKKQKMANDLCFCIHRRGSA